MNQCWESQSKNIPLDNRSKELRSQVVRMLEASGRGHIGSAFSLVEILRVLYDEVLRFNSSDPFWPNRDRLILSKGHGCLALYVLLAEKGFFSETELATFCNSTSRLGGHPEYAKVPGIEASTGSLGHGLPIGVGFALNERIEKKGYKTYVILGDGECDEGSVWESALSASKHQLSNLVVLVDYNKQQSYGRTSEILELEPFVDKWKAFGFAVEEVNGHDVQALRDCFNKVPFYSDRPSAIICHTIKGKGISFVEGNLKWHHKNKVAKEEIANLFAELEVTP